MTSARQRQDRSIVHHITLSFDGFSFPRLLISFFPFNPASAHLSVYSFRFFFLFYLKCGAKPRWRSWLGDQAAGQHPPGLGEAGSDKRLWAGQRQPPRGTPTPPVPGLRVRPAGEGGHSVRGMLLSGIAGNAGKCGGGRPAPHWPGRSHARLTLFS